MNSETYEQRRQRLLREVDHRPRGTRTQMAFDLRVPQGKLSNVLNNRERRPDVLDLVEGWLRERPVV